MATPNEVSPEVAPHGEVLSDEEVRRRIWEDPAARARIQDLIDYMKSARSRGAPVITAEELPDFLREYG